MGRGQLGAGSRLLGRETTWDGESTSGGGTVTACTRSIFVVLTRTGTYSTICGLLAMAASMDHRPVAARDYERGTVLSYMSS